MLTDKEVKQAKPKDKPYKLGDRNGLHLYVTTSGHRSWRYKYRIAGKERRIVFGTYPEMSLVDARERLDETRKQIRDGGDPQVIAARAKLVGATSSSKNFEAVAREWHHQQIDRWKPVHADDVITSMERDLFPDLGSWPVDQIDIPMLLAVLRKVEARGAIETAHRLRQRAQAVFRYARGIGINNINPAADIGTALKLVPKKRRWPALKEQSQICALMVCVDQAGASPVTRLASRFLALTAQRPGMVRHAEWREFENIDWSNEQADISRALWHVPASKMKQELHLRDNEEFSHKIPLPPQAVEVLRLVRQMTGRAKFVFCSGRSGNEPMSENAIGYLYNREGYKGRHVPHGWRSSFSTIMNSLSERRADGNDRLIIDRLIIDLMLAHTPAGLSEAELIYNRAAYPERRRELAIIWADLITKEIPSIAGILETRRRGRD